MKVFAQILEVTLVPIVLLLMKTAKQVADMLVKGDETPVWVLKLMYLAFVAAELFRFEIAGDGDNTYKVAGLDEFGDLCVDTLSEGGVAVGALPKFPQLPEGSDDDNEPPSDGE